MSLIVLSSATSIDNNITKIVKPATDFQAPTIIGEKFSARANEIIKENLINFNNCLKNSLNYPSRFSLYSAELARKLGHLTKQITSNTISPTNKQIITSAVAIDLNGNNIETIDTNAFSHFDFESNALRVRTAWVAPTDGLLVFDRNKDGKITNGRELFGHNTLLHNGKKASNGFEALKELDSNKDGKIDKEDQSYRLLQVWQDENYNGMVEKGELKTLSELNITAIDTNYKTTNHIDQYGNKHLFQATVTFSNGKIAVASNIWFKTEPGYRIMDDTIKIPHKIAKLPNAKAFGKLYDLHQAMVLDPLLIDSLNAYLNETDREKKLALLDLLIYRWAGSDLVDPYSRDSTRYPNNNGHFIDARQLVTLELLTAKNFMGTWQTGAFDPNPHHKSAPLLLKEYNKFKNFVAAQLFVQAEFMPVFGNAVVLEFRDSTLNFFIVTPLLEESLISLLEDIQTNQLEVTLTHLHNLTSYSKTLEKRLAINLNEILNRQVKLKNYLTDVTQQNTIEKKLLYHLKY